MNNLEIQEALNASFSLTYAEQETYNTVIRLVSYTSSTINSHLKQPRQLELAYHLARQLLENGSVSLPFLPHGQYSIDHEDYRKSAWRITSDSTAGTTLHHYPYLLHHNAKLFTVQEYDLMRGHIEKLAHDGRLLMSQPNIQKENIMLLRPVLMEAS